MNQIDHGGLIKENKIHVGENSSGSPIASFVHIQNNEVECFNIFVTGWG